MMEKINYSNRKLYCPNAAWKLQLDALFYDYEKNAVTSFLFFNYLFCHLLPKGKCYIPVRKSWLYWETIVLKCLWFMNHIFDSDFYMNLLCVYDKINKRLKIEKKKCVFCV